MRDWTGSGGWTRTTDAGTKIRCLTNLANPERVSKSAYLYRSALAVKSFLELLAAFLGAVFELVVGALGVVCHLIPHRPAKVKLELASKVEDTDESIR